MSDRILYVIPHCPHCQWVMDILEDLGVSYETVSVPQEPSERTTVKEISGQPYVPVFVDPAHDVEGMYESQTIVNYLRDTYGDDEAAASE